MTIKRRVDIYKVYDEDGNVVKELRYPQGVKSDSGFLGTGIGAEDKFTGTDYLKQEQGDEAFVYKPNSEDKEVWASTTEAEASVDIDPIAGKITVAGPKWLTNQIVNNDTFKKNFSENSALASAISLYQQNPDAKVETTGGDMMSVSDLISDYANKAGSYGESAAKIYNFEEDKYRKYGVKLNDVDVSVASNFVDKNNYNKNDVIYLTDNADWFYDWESLDSFDPENLTVSAEDFFEKAYKVSLSDPSMEKFQEEVLEKLKEFSENNTYDESDPEEVATKKEELESREYAEKFARYYQMYNILANNNPETTWAYNVAAFNESVFRGVLHWASEGQINLSYWLQDLDKNIAKVFSFGNSDAELAINRAWNASGADVIPTTIAMLAGGIGSGLAALEYGTAPKTPKDMLTFLGERFEDIAQNSGRGMAAETAEIADFYTGLKEELDEAKNHITGWWAAGDFVGYMIYKIAENVKLLNPLGSSIEAATKFAFSSSTFANFVGKVASEKVVAKMISGLAKMNNITAQATLETLLENREIASKAIAGGAITPELWGKFKENWIGNAIGEIALPLAGKATRAGALKAAEYSTLAKMGVMAAHHIASGVSKTAYKTTATFFAILNGVGIKNIKKNGLAKAIAIAMRNETSNQSRRLALYNIGLQAARSDAAKSVWQSSSWFVKKVDEQLADVTNRSYGFVYGGKEFLEATTEEAQIEAVEKGIKAAIGEGGKTAEEMAGDAKTAFGKSLDEHITEKYTTMQKNIMLRANFENQIDGITKGAILKYQEMISHSGKQWDDFVNATNKVAELTVAAEKNGASFHYWANGGTTLSKEGSEYLSLKAQHGRYAWKIEQVEKAGGDWKKAYKADGHTRIFSSEKDYKDTVAFANAQEKRIKQLRRSFGKDLTKAYDELHVASGRLHTSIMEYMHSRNYIDENDYKLFKNLAQNQGWGKNGEYYLPTQRLIKDIDKENGFLTGDAWLNEETKPARRMAQDNLKEYQMNSTEEFGDPVANLQMWIAQQSRIAQAQDFGRAIHAVSAPVRAVEGYDLDGVSKYEVTRLEQTMKEIKADFDSAFSNSKNSAFVDAMTEAITSGDIITVGVDIFANATPAHGKALKETTKATKAAASRVKTGLLGSGTTGLQSSIIQGADGDSLDVLIKETVGEGEIPIFDPSNVSAAEFQGWYDSLPKASKDMITAKLSGQKLNVTNVRKLMKGDNDFATRLKRNYVDSMRKQADFKKKPEYLNFLKTQYEKSVDFRKNTLLKKNIEEFNKLSAKQKKLEGIVAEEETRDLSDVFVKNLDNLSKNLLEEMRYKMRANRSFNEMVEKFVERGVEREMAENYILLNGLSKKSAKQFKASLQMTSGEKPSLAAGQAKKGRGALGEKYQDKVATLVSDSLKSTIDSDLASLTVKLQGMGVDDLLDTKTYFESIEKEMNEIEKTYGFKAGKDFSASLNLAQRRSIVQLVAPDGQLRYYETSPLYANLTNEPVGSYVAGNGFLSKAYRGLNRIFRFGTTGIDNSSYANQWMRDPLNATVIGAYRPFLDLSTGGLLSRLAGIFHDTGMPFGRKVFGKFATQRLTDSFVESTFEANKRGLIEMFGQEWFDNMAKEAAGDLTGDAAEMAIKRATAQFAVGEIGYKTLPGLGGVTTREFFRGTEKGVQDVTTFGLSKERAKLIFGASEEDYALFGGKFSRMLDSIDENLSKGTFRERLMRQGVFTSQYRAGVEAGLTHAEASTYATRYALDATTDFGRTFMWGNKFIQSVPYLGAAINGQKSFWRLLEMDPVGVTRRFVFGLALPYARMLSVCLSDPKNREVYKNLREYEKEDHLIFVWQGQIISIPAPQELSAFLAPFRQFVEESAEVQDHSWFELVTSDVLGILPLDMSGFVNLDANMFLDSENGIGTHIQRGTEKMLSGLMSPVAKAAYMLAFGRDPYTGRNINTDRVITDEEGNVTIMNSSQNALANWLGSKFPQVGATGAHTLLKTLFGRSVVGVLENAAGILSGDVGMGEVLDETIGQFMTPFEAGTYNRAVSDWQNAVRILYDQRNTLLNDDVFKSNYAVANDKNYSDEKRKVARAAYKEKLDAYSAQVLDATQKLKSQYPNQYTRVRAAQVLSLLTLPQGYTLNNTNYSDELRQDAYYDARNAAINTFVEMGFPDDVAGNTLLGYGYYDKYGEYQFKVYTPFEIEMNNSTMLGASERAQADVRAALKAADIDRSKMFGDEYQKARSGSKADYKQYKKEWNAQVVMALQPLVEKYGGIDTLIRTEGDRQLLEQYIFVDNPYKVKEYLKEIFQGVTK